LEDGDKLTLGNYNLRIKLKTTLLNERLRRWDCNTIRRNFRIWK
jgi:hypothetical protein